MAATGGSGQPLPAVRRRLEASPLHELAAVRPQPLRAVLRAARQRENLRLPPEASQPQGRLVVWRLWPASAAEPQWALPDAAAGNNSARSRGCCDGSGDCGPLSCGSRCCRDRDSRLCSNRRHGSRGYGNRDSCDGPRRWSCRFFLLLLDRLEDVARLRNPRPVDLWLRCRLDAAYHRPHRICCAGSERAHARLRRALANWSASFSR